MSSGVPALSFAERELNNSRDDSAEAQNRDEGPTWTIYRHKNIKSTGHYVKILGEMSLPVSVDAEVY